MPTTLRVHTGSVIAVLIGVITVMSLSSVSLDAADPASGHLIIDGLTVPDIAPLPAYVPTPSANLGYVQKVDLGRQLYFDTRLSKNNSVSCAFCHNPGTGFADARQFSIGAFGTSGGRQAPTVYNTGFLPLQFWDGRAGSLEEQAVGPIHNPIEMAEQHETVVPKIAKISGYQKQFQLIFGGAASLQHIGEAIAAFERTIVSQNSAFDKYVLGDSQALDDAAVRGLTLYRGKGRCLLCHNGPNFTDHQFHNLGVPQVGPLKEDLGRLWFQGKSGTRERSRHRRYEVSPKPRPICTMASSRPSRRSWISRTLEV